MRDRTEWTRGDGGAKNTVEFSRPCATCGKPFSIFVSKRIASGDADSNSFGLKNCELHRRGKIVDELETLRAEIAVLKRRDQELFAENMALKARLATYETVAQPNEQGPITTSVLTGRIAEKKIPWE